MTPPSTLQIDKDEHGTRLYRGVLAGLCVLGMSATPVINNLQEGKSLVEMVSGLAHEELNTRPTVPNCMKLHQRLVALGTRWAYAAPLAAGLGGVTLVVLDAPRLAQALLFAASLLLTFASVRLAARTTALFTVTLALAAALRRRSGAM